MRFFVVLLALAFFVGCSSKQEGFGIPDSRIKFQTTKFEDQEQIAQFGEIKFFKKSILEKSQVLKDIVLQENEALVGLAYLKSLDEIKSDPKNNRLKVVVPVANPNIETILSRFGKEPSLNLLVDFRGESSEADSIYEIPDTQIVAMLGTKEIKKADLNTNHFVFQSLEQRKFREITMQLNGQVSRILVSMEAQKNKLGLSEYLEKNVFNGKLEYSKAELMEHLKKIGFSPEELTPELEARFIEGLKQRKEQMGIEDYVAKNILKGPLKVSFSEPKAGFELSKEFEAISGYNDAPVSLVVFGSATCNDCQQAAKNIYEIANKYDGYLKINWIHQTSPQDGFSEMLAEATLCVGKQKPSKTLKFLNDLAAPPAEVSEDKFYSWADSNKINAENLKECLVQGVTKELLNTHNKYVQAVGVVSNPTVWVDGAMLEGNFTSQTLDASVKNKIAESGASALGAFFRKIKGKIGL